MKRTKHISVYKGLPLIDAKPGEMLELHITKSDIRGATRNDPAKCAAAMACQRTFKTDAEVHISRTYIKTPDKKAWIRFITPQSISREIVAFDRSHTFSPGHYTLVAAPHSNRLGVHRGKSTHPVTGTKRLAPMHMTTEIRQSARVK